MPRFKTKSLKQRKQYQLQYVRNKRERNCSYVLHKEKEKDEVKEEFVKEGKFGEKLQLDEYDGDLNCNGNIRLKYDS